MSFLAHLLGIIGLSHEADHFQGSIPAALGRITASLVACLLLAVIPFGAITFWLIDGTLSLETLVGASALAVIYSYVMARILEALAVRHLLIPKVAWFGSLLRRENG